ncbi:RNA polymerase sigma factor [Chondrinema litorale]|uniref:RNA polymerase sigma factor n=1 Tax=Chondrinema litorale TaxID=2994555 RepID=UPI002543E181|nr:sigma-70 family RNA polymerase sigma factor [Chondrinema litorale]UZR97392.1 sigma-70 family RNA polymerase sigma factor [Chondrinema litorale]
MEMSANIELQEGKSLSNNLKKGDINALKEIYLKHYDKFLSISIAFLKSKPEAEDVLHEAFMKFWEKRHMLKDDSDYQNYLFIILRNQLVSAVRTKAKVVLKEDFNKLNLSASSTESWLEHKELSKTLEQAIDKLPPKRKVVFNLKRQDGLTNQQISEKLGISTQMVEKQLKLAKQSITEYLQLHGEISLISILLFQIIFI